MNKAKFWHYILYLVGKAYHWTELRRNQAVQELNEQQSMLNKEIEPHKKQIIRGRAIAAYLDCDPSKVMIPGVPIKLTKAYNKYLFTNIKFNQE